MDVADSELIAEVVRNGSEYAFRQLYRRHAPRLYQLHLRFSGGDEADAEDLFQETWMRAARLFPHFKRDAPLFPWLRGIAVNVAREWLRRTRRDEQRIVSVDVDEIPQDQGEPAGRLDLDTAIAALPAGYRAVLILHDVEGLTHAEIARSLGVAIGTTKSQLFEARRAVRRALQARTHLEEDGARG
jgi:RNA polymerase sigma-70 factor (ECF subfamily)